REYEPLDFAVQYRESHLGFVSRLLEDNGLFYWFSHDADGHTLVIADDAAAFAPEDDAPRPLLRMAQGAAGAGSITRLTRTRALRATAVHLRDFDFEKPNAPPEAQQPGRDAWPAPYYEYPAGFTRGAAGSRRAEARMKALRADADTFEGESQSTGLSVGIPFTVEGAREACLNGGMVITKLTTRGSQTPTGGDSNVALHSTFRALPEGAPFAAPRRARRPRIRGVQTAVVTGSSEQDQALHVDEHGRVKVRFFWDREGQEDHTSSCWVRVTQPLMGGSMILPRVGWEVAIAFLHGDPDRPVVLGRVYNAEKTPPLSLPGARASGSLKSMSSPGAGGHNELVMADSAGGQGFGIHAQKDLNITVGHDKTEEIAVDEEHTVSVNGSSSVKVDETIAVSGNQSVDVGAVLSQKVSGSQSISVSGNDTTNAISNHIEKVSGSRSYSVSGNQITICNGVEYSITGSFARDVGALELAGTIGSIQDNIVGSLDETVGAVKVQLAVGDHGEQITGGKDETYAAAELHLTKGALSHSAEGSVTHLIGGLHYQKLGGDYVVKAPMITLLGAVGVFKGGGSELKLGGGPVVLKGTKIAVKGALIVKMGASMKLGS
ncbi:MAG TPA: type VI secretion system tip protein TssI/VgrG, partial [Candidatus Nanopelagicales bacterium]|nr:type VI secretion system tip protein TssI/VgrG [Candidatus Nanopelagicales bacterium]